MKYASIHTSQANKHRGRAMEITVSKEYRTATFTWSDDMQNCEVVAIGFTDEELDQIMEQSGHEGADVEGFEVRIAA
jgi:stress response protein YsnF